MITRALGLALMAVLTAALAAVPAGAVGVDGVGMSPVLPTGADGRPVLELGTEPVAVELRVRNSNDEARQARIYAASAGPRTGPGFALGGPGSASWIGLDEQTIELGPREVKVVTFTVDPRDLPAEAGHVALVLEAGSGSTLVTRAATVVRINATGVLGNAIAPFVVAAILLAALVLAHLARRRLERVGEAPARLAPA